MECQKQKDFWGEMEDKAKNIHTDILLLPHNWLEELNFSMDAKGTITRIRFIQNQRSDIQSDS